LLTQNIDFNDEKPRDIRSSSVEETKFANYLGDKQTCIIDGDIVETINEYDKDY